MKKILLILASVLVLLLLAASPFAPASPVIDWWAIGPSSASVSSGAIDLDATVGQGIIGQVTKADSELCSGYRCILAEFLALIYLPLIMK